MKKNEQKLTTGTKSKGITSDDDSDEDSLTKFMTPEVRKRILEKRKRNQAMLDKLKNQIDHFDSTTKVSEGSGTKKFSKKVKVSKKKSNKEINNKNMDVVTTNSNNLKCNQDDKDDNEATTQEQKDESEKDNSEKDDSEKEYEIEHICNHMRKRNTMLLLIKWKGYEQPTWEPEDVIRTSINNDVETYWEKVKQSKRQVYAEEKNKKREKFKMDLLTKEVPMCKLEHNIPTNFYQSMNAWEVENNSCNGKDCSTDFGVEKCSHNNVAWICEGRRRHICKVVYCNKCFFNDKNVVHSIRRKK